MGNEAQALGRTDGPGEETIYTDVVLAGAVLKRSTFSITKSA